MITAAPRLTLGSAELDSHQTQARLDQLERQEWLRWSIAFVIMLALTFGLFALSIPVIGGLSWAEQTERNIGLRCLLALVLLFDVFVVYQQILITRLRRDLAKQLRVVTTLDTLKEADAHASRLREKHKFIGRSVIDRRVLVNVLHEGKPTCIHGRIRDISEDGMDAVVPCSLVADEQVTLEFSMEDGHHVTASAIVRHCEGFDYAFEFVSIEPSVREQIAQLCDQVKTPAAAIQSSSAERPSNQNVMAGCEKLKACSVFSDKLKAMPNAAALMRQTFCLGDKTLCARYRVSVSGGFVPPDLFPNEFERAQQLIDTRS